MNKFFVALFCMFVFSTLVFSLTLYKGVMRDKQCENLMLIVNDESILKYIWNKTSIVFDVPTLLASAEVDSGSLYHDEGGALFELSSSKINIPKEYLTVGIRGNGISYKYIEPEKVETINVGYGYRKHLIFNVFKEDNAYRYTVSVDCNR